MSCIRWAMTSLTAIHCRMMTWWRKIEAARSNQLRNVNNNEVDKRHSLPSTRFIKPTLFPLQSVWIVAFNSIYLSSLKLQAVAYTRLTSDLTHSNHRMCWKCDLFPWKQRLTRDEKHLDVFRDDDWTEWSIITRYLDYLWLVRLVYTYTVMFTFVLTSLA